MGKVVSRSFLVPIAMALLWQATVTQASAQPVQLMSPSAAGASVSATGTSHDASFSSDGRYVAFLSTASDLVPGQIDSNGDDDVFLFDRLTGATTLVDHALGAATTTGNRPASNPPALSADGRFVAFASSATNLVASPLPTYNVNVFLFDRSDGSIRLVSHTLGSSAIGGNSLSSGPTISADGETVAFYSFATDLVAGTDTNQDCDVFLYSRSTGAVVLVSHVSGSALTTAAMRSYGPMVSSDSKRVVFTSQAPDILAMPTSGIQLYSYDTNTGTNTLISHAFAAPTQGGNGDSFLASTSADGNRVAFMSRATDLVSGTDTNGVQDVFLYDGARHHRPGQPRGGFFDHDGGCVFRSLLRAIPQRRWGQRGVHLEGDESRGW